MVRPVVRYGISAAIAVGVGAACATAGSGPDDVSFDAAAVRTSLDATARVLGAEPWVSFATLNDEFALSNPPAPQRAVAAPAIVPLRVPLVPEQYLGTTYVYDGGLSQYVADPVRAGAPVDGVRFVLYPIDPLSETPVVDVELGSVDVADHGADLEVGFEVHTEAVTGGDVFLAYTGAFGADVHGALQTSAAAGALDHDGPELEGFVTDLTDTLSFEIVTGTVNGFEISTFALRLHGRSFSTAGTVTVAPDASTFIDMTIEAGGAGLHLSGGNRDGLFEAEIQADGVGLATVEMKDDALTVRGWDGRSLTADEQYVAEELTRQFATIQAFVADLASTIVLP